MTTQLELPLNAKAAPALPSRSVLHRELRRVRIYLGILPDGATWALMKTSRTRVEGGAGDECARRARGKGVWRAEGPAAYQPSPKGWVPAK
jgi:hypothetical protein